MPGNRMLCLCMAALLAVPCPASAGGTDSDPDRGADLPLVTMPASAKPGKGELPPEKEADASQDNTAPAPDKDTAGTKADADKPSATDPEKPGQEDSKVKTPDSPISPDVSARSDADRTEVEQGSVADFTALRTKLERLKLQVAIEEQERRLNKTGKAAAPKRGTSGFAQSPDVVVSRPAPARPRVVSIQGVDGRLTATLYRAGTGFLDVRAGDRAMGGRVVSVGPDRVVMRLGGRNVTLGFRE